MGNHKTVIWAFPGLGKSSLALQDKQIVDAECRLFQFKGISAQELHQKERTEGVIFDEAYPENYLNYIRHVPADIVLVNCHLSLLEKLDQESVLVVYPHERLIPEYLARYEVRGDHDSFIAHMAEEAKGILAYIKQSDFQTYEVCEENLYLRDLFERNDFKVKLMTRRELIAQLQRAMDLQVIDTKYEHEKAELICDLNFVENVPSDRRIVHAATWAEAVLDGKVELDIDQLLDVCSQREAELKKEAVLLERRGGLSRKELEDKIMQGIVNGALGVRYGEIAPYTHGYEVTFGSPGPAGTTRDFQNRWECFGDFFDIPPMIVSKIENEKQNHVVMGRRTQPLDIHMLLKVIEDTERHKRTSFVPEKETDFKRWEGYHRGSVATVMDVHAGKGLDGIVKHHYHGDYSTITPIAQNNLVETLVYLKGFCLDALSGLDIGPSGRDKVVNYLKEHGTDVSTPEKLQAWIKANPDKCALEENRLKGLDQMISKAASRTSPEKGCQPESNKER